MKIQRFYIITILLLEIFSATFAFVGVRVGNARGGTNKHTPDPHSRTNYLKYEQESEIVKQN